VSNKEDLTNGRTEVYAYGIEALFSAVYNYIPLLIFGHILGHPLETLVIYLTFSILRINGGGKHANTRFACFITTQFMYFIAFGFAVILKDFAWILIIVSLLLGVSLVPIIPKPSEKSLSRGFKDFLFRERFIKILISLFILSIIFNEFNLYILSNSISFGIIALKVLLLDKTEEIIDKIWEVLYNGEY
jgi:accessory gene regulator protein AgrB